MKESKFIELLNLYIDQQISPDEAALLEAEILRHPQRRRTYREYCQLHRACTLVFEDAKDRAEAGRVIEFAPRRRVAWGYWAAGLAAAACVALVTVQGVRRAAPAASAPPAAVAVAPAPRAAAPLVAVHMDAGAPRAYSFDTVSFVADRLTPLAPGRVQNATSLVIVSGPAGSAARRPLTAVKNAPNPARPTIEQFVFEQAATTPDAPQVFRVRQTGDNQEQMAAYQFQR
ncbi:MAG TPA: hypothetical protein VMD31_05335 [Opitutaceae bacterium]|nr:hypothetical protein [Opitutaceae bacterium]